MPIILSDLNLEVREVLRQVLNDTVPSDDTDLIETGLLDSLALVSLIMELETSFAINIDFDALELESFRSVNSITSYVAGLSA